MSVYNVKDELQDMSPEEIKEFYMEGSRPEAVACINQTGGANIGIMLRTASIFGMRKFHVIGRRKYDRRSAVGADHHIDMVKKSATKGPHNEELDIPKVKEILKDLEKIHTLVFVEQCEASWKLKDLRTSWTSVNPPLFVMGNESDGIPPAVMDEFPEAVRVEIPQYGVGRSFNVATACAMVLYEWYR